MYNRASILIRCSSECFLPLDVRGLRKNIDSIYVFGNPACEPLIFHKIKPNTKKTKNLLNCNKSGNDGSYLFSIYYNDTIVNKSHGYFTNGVPIFKNITISINKDNTISISEN